MDPPARLLHLPAKKLPYTLPHTHRNDTGMTALPRKYNAKIQEQAGSVDPEPFNRMESIIEDYGLVRCMEEAEDEGPLTVHEAKKHYRSLKKD